jgi:toxin-antitoxin system PIN domain toxin
VSFGLLDVNALIALLWEEHPFHKRCAEWFIRSANAGWATCPITESGCVRVLCTPAFTANPPSVHSAIRLIQAATESGSNHHSLRDDLPLSAVGARWRNRLGHKQITDAYLLALAMHHKAKLVTFDRRMEVLAPEGSVEREALVILRP